MFTKLQQFKAVLADTPIETDAKIIRNLLNIALCDIKAYSRLESDLTYNLFAADNLASEISKGYMLEKFSKHYKKMEATQEPISIVRACWAEDGSPSEKIMGTFHSNWAKLFSIAISLMWIDSKANDHKMS